jgi:Dolichyl-phosphate-mannose-protein mannosyltransferase
VQVDTASTTSTTPAWEGRPPARRGRRRFAIGLALIALAGAGIRLGYVLAGGGNDTSGDGLYYYFAANVLVDGGGFVNPWSGMPTALHPPAWPVVLGPPSLIGLDTLLAHQVFACVVGTATVVLVGLAGREIAGRRVGLLAAAIAAAHPNLWVRERELAAETLVLPLTAVVVILAYRYWRVPHTVTLLALGAACGVLLLAHSAMVLLLVVLVPALVVRAQPDASAARRLARMGAAFGIVGLVLLPWVVRNTVRFERPVFLTTNLGRTLRAGNCPAAYAGERLGWYDLDIVRPVAVVAPGGCAWNGGSGDESEQDARVRNQAIRYIREHAGRVPVVVAAREGRTWGLYRPFQQATFERDFGNGPLGVYQVAVFAHWALAPFAVAGAVRLRSMSLPLFPLLSFLLAVAVIVAATIGSVRYRAPAEVPIVLLAAVGVDAAWERWCRRPSSTPRNASTTSSASAAVSSV